MVKVPMSRRISEWSTEKALSFNLVSERVMSTYGMKLYRTNQLLKWHCRDAHITLMQGILC